MVDSRFRGNDSIEDWLFIFPKKKRPRPEWLPTEVSCCGITPPKGRDDSLLVSRSRIVDDIHQRTDLAIDVLDNPPRHLSSIGLCQDQDEEDDDACQEDDGWPLQVMPDQACLMIVA